MSLYIRTRRVSVTRYNTETLALQAAIIANAGTISQSSFLAADAFVTACKQTGVWPKLIDCGLFIGDQLAAALVKLVYPNGGQALITNHGFLAGDYNEQGALAGLNNAAASKYLSIGTTGNVANLGAIAFYANTPFGWAGGNSDVAIGAGTGAGNVISLGQQRTQPLSGTWGAEAVASNLGAGGGLYVLTNNPAANLTIFGGLQQGGAAAGVAAPNIPDEFYVFAVNEGNAASQFAACRGSFYALTTALSAVDVANLNTAVQTLQIALNRNV